MRTDLIAWLKTALTYTDRLALGGTPDSNLKGRNPAIEALRIVAAFGIVAFHSHAGLVGQLGYSGLVVFLFLLAYFETKSTTVNLRKAASKLLIPWALWFAVFSLVETFNRRPPTLGNNSIFTDVLMGPSPHLWFLPFAFFVTLILQWTKRWMSNLQLAISAGVGCVVLTYLHLEWLSLSNVAPHPFPEYAFALLPIFMGVVVATNTILGLAVTTFIISYSVSDVFVNGNLGSLVYTIGILCSLIALYVGNLPILSINVGLISRLMFGVYLSHPIFINLARFWIGNSMLGVASAAFLFSIVFTWILSGRALSCFTRNQIVHAEK